jgi:DUF1680 family protein
MKLARYLLRFIGDPRYGDGLERVLYNTILGSIEPSDNGDYFYYSDYQSGARKGYYKKKWPCCSGTLVQGVADYAVSLYFQDSSGIYVNLFAPSEVRWSAGGVPVRLIQDTAYPNGDEVELRVDVPKTADFAIHVRMPAWLSGAATVRVNGRSVDVPAERKTFATIRRRWQKNDTVVVKLPFRDRTEAIDDRHTDTVALMRGPLMMVAVNAPEGMSELTAPGLRFAPFYTVRGESYTTYFKKRLG